MTRAAMLREREAVETLGTVTVSELRVWVSEGWVTPARTEDGPAFDAADLARLRLVRDLRDDLGLDEEAIPVVLSLLDQVHGLRRELRALAAAVDALPPEARAAVRAAYRARVAED